MEMGLHYPPKVKRLNLDEVNKRQRRQAKHGASIESECDSELNSISNDDVNEDCLGEVAILDYINSGQNS